MAGNSFGKNFCLTTFGESHGSLLGGVIDGCPSNLVIDLAFIQSELDRRKPGQSMLTSARDEEDKVEFVSGIFEGITTGAPIAFFIKNSDQRPEDYSEMNKIFRPSHADYTYYKKFKVRDYRGGGRSSARETATWVVAGAIAKLILLKSGISITAFTSSIGKIKLNKPFSEIDLTLSEQSPVRCPDTTISKKMIEYIQFLRKKGDSTGGIVTAVIKGTPVGLGEPVFDKLHADLGKAMLSINAVKAFEYGSGFSGTEMTGSEHNDLFFSNSGVIDFATNRSGGIQGGISNGQDIYFNVGFKPVATIMQQQKSVNVNAEPAVINPKGRHDVCVVSRAVPIVEAMAALVITDHLLRYKASKL